MSTSASTEPTEEFHSAPVPLSARLGFAQPAWVWSGFGIAFICAVIGGTIQNGLGTRDAILAIVLGNVLLFVYAAALGYASGKWGLSFPLTVKAVFGSTGAIVPIVVLALLVTGWYSFHTWLTADILAVAFSIESAVIIGLIALAVGVLYALPVIYGFQSMALLRKVAIPAMVVFVAYYLVTRVLPAGGDLFSAEGTGDITFFAGVGMAWATFAVSGTMTGDIVRYTRTGGQAVGVTGLAFLVSNAPFMIMGVLFAAAIDDPTVPYFLDSTTASVLVPIAVVAILSTWSTADACLYNASLGFSSGIRGVTWRRAGMLGAAIGVVLAVTGVIGDVSNMLIAIGLVVPPFGAVIIADYFAVRRSAGFGADREASVNVAAIIATAAGIGVGIVAYLAFPTWIFGIPGMAVTMTVYVVLAKVAGPALGAAAPTIPNAAEAVGVRRPATATEYTQGA